MTAFAGTDKLNKPLIKDLVRWLNQLMSGAANIESGKYREIVFDIYPEAVNKIFGYVVELWIDSFHYTKTLHVSQIDGFAQIVKRWGHLEKDALIRKSRIIIAIDSVTTIDLQVYAQDPRKTKKRGKK